MVPTLIKTFYSSRPGGVAGVPRAMPARGRSADRPRRHHLLHRHARGRPQPAPGAQRTGQSPKRIDGSAKVGANGASTDRMPSPSQLAVEHESQPARRERLRHQQQRVALDQPDVTPIECWRGDLAGVMRHDRLITTRPAGHPQTQGQIDILQIGEVALVETADVEHRTPVVQRSARAGAEHLAGLIEATVV
jgi:hypothetical protein